MTSIQERGIRMVVRLVDFVNKRRSDPILACGIFTMTAGAFCLERALPHLGLRREFSWKEYIGNGRALRYAARVRRNH